MPQQQKLKQLKIDTLKNLKDVNIDFEDDDDKKLTAILGPNGFGKSTVLHALAVSFKPTKVTQGGTVSYKGEDYRYTNFFPNTPYGVWNNSSFTIVHFFREGPSTQSSAIHMRKGLGQWYPQAHQRPEREIYFIGVASATPEIENPRAKGRVNFVSQDLADADSLEILQRAGTILNRNYTRYHDNRISNSSTIMGVEYEGINYSALSMGAGEQRLFRILRVVKAASKYALILIDELDLLMHTDALHRLLKVLNDYATDKNLQIIFTTHRESVVDFEKFIALRHLYRGTVAPHRTFCFNDSKPDAIYRLTGNIRRPLQISCEDDISTAIIEKVAQQTQVGKFVEISSFGASDNCFTLAAALILNQQNTTNSLLVLDGDVFTTPQLRLQRINTVFTGNEIEAAARRQQALDCITEFRPNDIHCPEEALYLMIVQIPLGADPTENEIINVAIEFSAELEPKIRLAKMIDRLGGSKETNLVRIIDVAAKSEYWIAYTILIREWFEQKRPLLLEMLEQAQ